MPIYFHNSSKIPAESHNVGTIIMLHSPSVVFDAVEKADNTMQKCWLPRRGGNDRGPRLQYILLAARIRDSCAIPRHGGLRPAEIVVRLGIIAFDLRDSVESPCLSLAESSKRVTALGVFPM